MWRIFDFFTEMLSCAIDLQKNFTAHDLNKSATLAWSSPGSKICDKIKCWHKWAISPWIDTTRWFFPHIWVWDSKLKYSSMFWWQSPTRSYKRRTANQTTIINTCMRSIKRRCHQVQLHAVWVNWFSPKNPTREWLKNKHLKCTNLMYSSNHVNITLPVSFLHFLNMQSVNITVIVIYRTSYQILTKEAGDHWMWVTGEGVTTKPIGSKSSRMFIKKMVQSFDYQNKATARSVLKSCG